MIQRTFNLLSEFSIPLLLGVSIALLMGNLWPEEYHSLIHAPLLWHDLKIFGHTFNFHFLMNDIFMVFFFGIATVEITQAVAPGGSLNPISRAINPLLGTLGGILGPVAVYLLLCVTLNVETSIYRGWGIPTATDIAIAWLVARLIFGQKHPAVAFLLLLAVADDAIGLGIIAVAYTDPNHPVELAYLLITILGALCAWILNRKNVTNFWWYLILGGLPAWLGLILAHLHPALALIFVVPFMPAGHGKHKELFIEEAENTTIANFEHFHKIPVDIGLLGFGLANAGVAFSQIGQVTWIVLLSLAIGKILGITLFSMAGSLFGSHLAKGMQIRDLFVVSIIAGIGLTVALFVAGEAFIDPSITSAAKMGALFSGGIALPAFLFARLLNIQSKK